MELSAKGKKARSDYFRERYAKHPETVKRYQLNVWENKAKQKYGRDYIPARPGEALSDQARLLRREYNRKYRDEHRDEIRAYSRAYQKEHRQKTSPEKQKEYICNYWERRAEKS